MNSRRQLGEVIATSYSSFTVESYELNSTPPLGSLVVAQNVVGVVCSARTDGLGPISARGNPSGEDNLVYEMYPDLERTLRSQFSALVVGCYNSEDDTREPVYTFPECPPTVHYKCWAATDAETVRFTEQPDYLRLLLFSNEAPNVDQVVIHLIVRAFRARGRDYQWLSSTAEYLGRQLKGQYDRLLAILKTLDSLTAQKPQPSTKIAADVGNIRL